jgi:hypothetical protein
MKSHLISCIRLFFSHQNYNVSLIIYLYLADCQTFSLLFLLQGGGFDKLTLDSLYDDGTYRQMQQQLPYGSAPHNPFMASDPFVVPNQVAPPPSVQMATMAQQPQQSAMAMQPNPFGPPLQPQQLTGMAGVPNPFLDAGFGPFPAQNGNGMHPQANPFGTAQLL